MEKIDRLGWAAGVAFDAYGLKLGVRVNHESALDRALAALPYGWRHMSSPYVDNVFSVIHARNAPEARIKRYNVVYSGGSQIVKTLDEEKAFRELQESVEAWVTALASRKIFVHAGVVTYRGKALLLPGRTHTGKTTLVMELVKAGATYFSDEFAVLDDEGRVHPYPRPLSIRSNGGPALDEVRVESIGGRVGKRSVPVGLVVMTYYKEGSRWNPHPISAGKGALELLNNTIPAQVSPEAVMNKLQQVVLRAPVWKGVRGEAAATAHLILDRMAN
jgi:hypothetical protein